MDIKTIGHVPKVDSQVLMVVEQIFDYLMFPLVGENFPNTSILFVDGAKVGRIVLVNDPELKLKEGEIMVSYSQDHSVFDSEFLSRVEFFTIFSSKDEIVKLEEDQKIITVFRSLIRRIFWKCRLKRHTREIWRMFLNLLKKWKGNPGWM